MAGPLDNVLGLPPARYRIRGVEAKQAGLVAAAVLAALSLFARIMTYPLRHDEQLYLPAGILFSPGSLYPELGFNHFPNLPILLFGVFAAFGVDHFLLVGRLVVFLSWIAACVALAQISYRYTASTAVTALLLMLFVMNPILLGPTGMLVSNNFIAIPFALFGLHFFLMGADRPEPRRGLILLSGVFVAAAIGFKANYIFLILPFALAALHVARRAATGRGMALVTLPFVLGGLIAGAPALYYLLSDPAGFVAHTVSYHRGPHVDYWLANSELDGTKILGWGSKFQVAHGLWLAGTTILIPLTILFMLVLLGARSSGRTAFVTWPILLVMALVALASLISFAPTPAFPQYYTPPIPFGIVLVALLYGRLDAAERSTARPFLQVAAILCVVAGMPLLAAALPKVAPPSQWTGYRVHESAQAIRAAVNCGGANANASLATLAPVYGLEAGLAVYPQLALGPFIYRVAERIPESDRRHYRYLSSRAEIAKVLESSPPTGILVGFEGDLELPLAQFAETNGYRKMLVRLNDGRDDAAILYVRPGQACGR